MGYIRTEFTANIADARYEELLEELEDERSRIEEAGYDDPRASVVLPDDHEYHRHIYDVADRFDPDVLVVCGIGGSNLGTIAVHEAVHGTFHTEGPELYFADTVDPGSIGDLLSIVDARLAEGKEVAVNIVTKSGGTTETISNGERFISLLQEHGRDPKEHVVITTDETSPLRDVAGELGITTLTIPENVGGRYSVFSAVGLFPLAVIGVDVEDMLKGAREMRDAALEPRNDAMRSAATIFHHDREGRNIHDTFLFSTELESVGKWYRQLTAESLGKHGHGMLPNVSIGSTDLHSMVQRYLGGPDDLLTTFVNIETDVNEVHVPELGMGFEELADAEGYSYTELRNAILQGTMEEYEERDKPYMQITLPDRSSHSIGQFLQFKMIEIMYLAELLGVNAFNQPNVEEYKEKTRNYL